MPTTKLINRKIGGIVIVIKNTVPVFSIALRKAGFHPKSDVKKTLNNVRISGGMLALP